MKRYRSEVIWAIWAFVGVAWELWCVFREKRTGDEPLTRLVRDRLMKRYWPFRLAGLLFLTWLFLHFVLPLRW